MKRVAEDIIIRVTGDGNKMKGKESDDGDDEDCNGNGALPTIRVDGPYGSPNEVRNIFIIIIFNKPDLDSKTFVGERSEIFDCWPKF